MAPLPYCASPLSGSAAPAGMFGGEPTPARNVPGGRANCAAVEDASGEVCVVVNNLAGEELCRLRCGRRSNLTELIAALEASLGERLDDGHLLIHGGRILGGRATASGAKPALCASNLDVVQLTLVLQQTPVMRHAIDRLKGARGWQRRIQALTALVEDVKHGDPEVIEEVVACLRDQDLDVRCSALSTLERVAERGDEMVIGAVSDCLGDAAKLVRGMAAKALGQIADKGVEHIVDAVAALLTDPEASVRHRACQALEQIAESGDQRVIVAVAARLDDPTDWVRRAAESALQTLQVSGL